MPAVPSCIIEPIFEQFSELLPDRKVDHLLGCHHPRIPHRVVFEELVAVLLFGCAYGQDSRPDMLGNHAQAPQRRVDQRRSHGEATTDSARSLRLDDRSRSLRCGWLGGRAYELLEQRP